MKSTWRTAWQGQDIVVYRDDAEAGRVPAARIERVVLVFSGSGESPGDLVRSLVELDNEWLVFEADTGFAGRVNFERQDFWAERACVYWVPEGAAALPPKLRRGTWTRLFAGPAFSRVPRDDLEPLVAHWPLQGPQTWEQRKWRRIARARPFAPDENDRLRA